MNLSEHFGAFAGIFGRAVRSSPVKPQVKDVLNNEKILIEFDNFVFHT